MTGLATHSIEVPAPHDASPDELRRAAHDLGTCAAEVTRVMAVLRATVDELTTGPGEWRGPTADAFRSRAWEPIVLSLRTVAGALEDGAASLRRAAMSLQAAQDERRRAEVMAAAAGVGVALTVLTVGISDAVAAEAAAGAAVLIGRAAATAAAAARAMMAALEEAAASVRIAAIEMRTWGTALGASAAVALPRVMASPVATGILGAAETAAGGDLDPRDLAVSAAVGALEGTAGATDELEEPQLRPPRRFPVDLVENEALEGTHVIERHVGKTLAELRQRFVASRSSLRRSSTFPDIDTAQRAVQEAIDANEDRIAAWLNSRTSPQLRPDIAFDVGRPIGEVLTREAWQEGGPTVTTRWVRVILRRSSTSPTGFTVVTAFADLPPA